ncbi:MAG TPA: phage holin family protein [Gaiellaceae bacterium]|nr:phage holin family protein [Gaiellaceae bacterium]
MSETVDSVEAPTEVAERDEAENGEQEQEAESVTELAVQLGHDVSVLAFCEAQLAAHRNMPEVRRTARDILGAVLAAVAFLTAFVFVNAAAMLGLSTAVSPWLAAVIMAIIWIVLGGVLAIALMIRAGHVTGWKWWHVFTAGPEETLNELESARDEAEQAVRETLARLAPALTIEIAAAAVPMAGDMAEGVVDAGSDILEASDDMVESLADDLPGGGVVNQMWDVVLMPGRFGIKVASTVLKRDEPES